MAENGDRLSEQHCPEDLSTRNRVVAIDQDESASSSNSSNDGTKKDSILKQSKFGSSFGSSGLFGSSFGGSFGNGKGFQSSLLRPSKLDNSATLTGTGNNTPALFNNPFKRPLDDDDVLDESPKKTKGTEDKPTVTFMPLNATVSTPSSSLLANTANSSSSTSNAAMFVFGKNLHERVEGVNAEDAATSNNTASMDPATSNGTVDTTANLITSAVNEIEKSNGDCAVNGGEKKSLSEAAKEYEESRTQKPKYEEVQVVTGEEDEDNVLQMSCKLFAFDQATKNWQERGRGTLRLNDFESEEKCVQSRLVVRASGSLRVVLNTKIWAGMTVELASEKSLRLTAMDNLGVVKVFLVMAGKKEVEQLHTLLKLRVQDEIKRQPKITSAKPLDADVTDSIIEINEQMPSDNSKIDDVAL